MERLTYKNYIEEYELNFEKSFDKNWSISESDTHIKVTGEPIEKLGELEDVLEKWHIEDLDKFIEEQIAKKRELNDILWGMEKELAELKQKAIIPKFQVNQEIWYYHIGKNKIYSGIIEDIQWRPVNGMYYRIPNLQRDYFWIREDELFATQEEAEQKLAEIKKGEKDE